MKTLHIVHCRLNSWPHPSGNYLNRKWLEFRIELFKDLVLPCYKEQYYQDFILIGKIHPDTPEDIKLKFYQLELLNERLRIVENYEEYRAYLYEKHKPGLCYETRADSDDILDNVAMGMYHRPRRAFEWEECRYFQDGYYWDVGKDILAKWDYPEHSSPQFLTYIIPGKQWAYERDDWYKERWGGLHTMGCRFEPSEQLKGRHFMVLGHGVNASQQSRFAGSIIHDPEPVFRQFNITEQTRKKWIKKCNDKINSR